MFWNKKSSNNSHNTSGQHWESKALEYLEKQQLIFVTANFHSRQGEIDLIMKEGNCVVFVEVKYRKNKAFGGAISAVSISKQEKIRRTAAFFLQQQGLNAYNTACRFDIIAIEGGNIPEFIWLKNAF
ncbi:YraN family protein [Thalassotalea sp. 1_MG-2023]|uniref:YraN family protein n=1 Tax=Thalassotalea sp. 1_MG-2023 TaxID=3062680 RepID=UPI0026E17B38|nr:YraN family protein [Thalassotalea sp. 1_MG-2023]MDO6425854.1 YraN family protein [Thalassotalea sp. 1_MG-2023]